MTSRKKTGPTVKELGEFPLIERLAARLGPVRSDVIVGIGDDVAAMRVDQERLVLVTCDVQVAGTHFLPDRCDPRRLGRKAAAINISDIAGSGGTPTHFLVSLVIPDRCEVAFLEALYDGLAEEAGHWGADVIGGNVSRGEMLAIDLTLLGEVSPDELLRRDGARVGDLVMVSATLGLAAAGLHLVRNPGVEVDPAARRAALDAYEIPTPRVNEARVLAGERRVSAMIDVSDGLAADLGHLCEASRVGVVIDGDRIPISAAASVIAKQAGTSPIAWALGGGEDYELLFTAPADRAEALAARLFDETGTRITTIGEVVPVERGRTLRGAGGAPAPLADDGWRHF